MLYKKPNSPYWHYDFTIKGNRFCGSTRQTAKAAARKVEAKRRLEVAEGDDRTSITLDMLCSTYWDEIAHSQPSAKTTLYQMTNLTTAFGGSTALSSIKQGMIAGYAAKRRAKVSDSSVNREIELAKRLWRFADRRFDAHLAKIDWQALKYKEPKERVRELSEDEEDRLFVHLREDLHDFVRFAIMTGARKASITGLLWSNIDFNARVMRFAIKGGGYQTLPITHELMLLLSNQPRVGPYVFTYECQKSRGGRKRGERYPLTSLGWHKAWNATLRAAEIEDFRFHDLRHTAATRLMRRTGNLLLTQKLLGHTDISTTARYAHVNDEDLRAAMEGETRTISAPKTAISSSD